MIKRLLTIWKGKLSVAGIITYLLSDAVSELVSGAPEAYSAGLVNGVPVLQVVGLVGGVVGLGRKFTKTYSEA